MEYILDQLVNGLCQDAIYTLMTIGYSVIVGVIGMVTLTYGEIMMIGAFSSYCIFLLFDNNLPLATLAAFTGSFLIGIVVYKLCYEKFFNAPRHISLLCTTGISMPAKNLAQIVFGPETKPVLGIVENKTFTFILGSVRLDIKLLQIVVIVLVVVLASALTLFSNRTKWGIALRTVSQNKDAAYLVGIDVKCMAMIGNCIGPGFGGVVGILLYIYYYSVSTTMDGIHSMKAFTASMLGGLVDIRFSVLDGLCIGVIESLGVAVSATTFRDVFAFGLLILVLLIRPQGFVGKKGVRIR